MIDCPKLIQLNIMVNKWLIINTLRNNHIFTRKIKSIAIDTSSISSGRYAVTARCNIDGSLDDMLIKCYLMRPRRAKQIYGSLYLKGELGIYKTDGTMEYIDVALSNWVDGVPLNEIIDDPDIDHHRLSRNFDILAHDVLTSQRCHIDIKPDNIIVRADDSMALIDNDALRCNIPTAPQSVNDELARVRDRYAELIHKATTHYSLALVSTMLAALAHDYKATIHYVETGVFEDSKSRRHAEALERCKWLFVSAHDDDHLAIVEALISNSLTFDLLHERLRAILALP